MTTHPPRRLFLILMLWAALAGGPAGAQPSGAVTVFAAASLKTALDEVAARYRAVAGGETQIAYAGSSALARQILYGAPAQIYISANPGWMDVVEARGGLRAGSRTDLLGNRLVLIAPSGSDADLRIAPGFDLAGALGGGRLAMALVDAVPAGIYGRAALEALGVWGDVRERIAQADNVRAALRLVALDEAPLGIVYATDAAADPRVRVLDRFPADSHPPIVYPAALLRDGQSPASEAFFAFLTGPEARAIFQARGFSLPGGGP